MNWQLSQDEIKYFYNTCFYRIENVLINTFNQSNKDCFIKKLKYNRKVLRSKEFKKWYSKFTGNMHFIYRFSYKLGCYLPIVLLRRLKK
jgi:ribosome-binding factor A